MADPIAPSRWLRAPLFVALMVAAALFVFQAGAGAQDDGHGDQEGSEAIDDAVGDAEEDPEEEARNELLREGQQVYSQICASCHQAGGIGVVGQYPPLRGNERTTDAEYVRTVIETGRSGELVVDGVTYDSIMPSFSTLSDDDTDAVVAFITNDFVAPAAAVIAPTGPIAGTELPGFANFGAILAYAIAAIVGLLVLGPRIVGVEDRLRTPWLDAWLKTAVIVMAVILLTVIVPDWIVRSSAVSGLGRFAQDFIGVAAWGVGLVVVMAGLWWAHRESRV